MTVERNVALVAAAVLAVLAVLVMGSTGVAMAAAPNVAIDAPVAGSSTNNQMPPFGGTTDDVLDPVTLHVYAGTDTTGSPVQTLIDLAPLEIAPGEATWVTAPESLEPGQYTAVAEQTNAEPATGQSLAVTFTIDTAPPAVSIGPVVSPTRDSTPSLVGGAGTAVGDDATVTVSVYEGGSVGGVIAVTKSVVVSAGGWSYTPPTLADGTYTAQVSQGDEAGNTGESAAVTFTVDTTAPVVAVTVPVAGAVLNSSKPTISGLAGQVSGDDPSVTLKLYAGSTVSGSPVQTDKVTPSGANWTTGAVAALADGTYTALAEQADEAGNTGTSLAVTFTIDTTLPAVTLTSPSAGSSTSTEFEAFSGAAGTATRDLPQITVRLFAGSTITSGAPLREATVPVASGHWSAAFGGLNSGTYTAQAQQSDNTGRTGFSEPVTFTVNIPPPSTSPVDPPVVSTPPAGTSPPSPPVASFQWFPSAPRVGEPVSLISTSTDATGQITGFAWSVAGDGVFTGGSSTITTSFATPGAHVVLLRVTDAGGISSVVAKTIPVTSPAPILMQPFPVVRIAGSENASGVRVGLLTVQAPVGATVSVTCRGPGCPARSQNVIATSGKSKGKAGMVTIVLRRFERSLRAGAVLEIRVSKSGQIGKYTRFTVRHGKLPVRVDTCLSSAGTKPIVCPS
ncbi:MAG: Ig-like domain-containing protein [Solirubrobacteraceae bacterium]